MNREPLISVIVPVYKTEAYLRRCVDSILEQTYRNLEVILVDDGSPDQCPELCDAYVKTDERVIVIHQENGGQSSARNRALDICRGDYISFVDSDDWLELETYEAVMGAIRQHDVDAVLFAANIIEPDGTKSEKRFAYFPEGTIKTADEMVRLTLEDTVGGQPCVKVYARKCWEGVRFPEGRIYEDLAISFRPFLRATSGSFFFQRAFYNYQMNLAGTSLSANPQKTYHIFLAFKDHYDYAKANASESEEACLEKTSSFALQYLNVRMRSSVKGYLDEKQDVVQWLHQNRSRILKCEALTRKEKMRLQLYFASPALYSVVFRLFLALGGERKHG